MNSKIIAVDFDGTLCENKCPEIGEANEDMIYYLRKRQAEGDKLILWTCRVGDMLRKAINWCYNYGLIFNAVNENLPEIIDSFGSDTRKIFANEYIDDRNTWPQKNDAADILYLCDGKSCENTCPSVECKHTSDISHAKNFVKGDYDSYWEKEKMMWRPISEYSREKYDWVLVKYFDGDFECVPTVAEMRPDGKWYVHGILKDEEIPFDIRYFADMQLLDWRKENESK